MEEKKITEETEVKVTFIKRHLKAIKRGAIVVAGVVGLAVIAALVNKKGSSDDDTMDFDNEPNSGTEE